MGGFAAAFSRAPHAREAFWIDKYPVTNAQFKKFMDATHYHPQDDLNFLRDWQNGSYPAGSDNKPVTWVSLEDARAYADLGRQAVAARMGVAIRGARHRRAALSVGQRVERRGRAGSGQGPDDARAGCRGCASSGRESVRRDGSGRQRLAVDGRIHRRAHRAGILRGGSYYQPQGSIWYFPQAYKLTEHGKFLLTSPSLDRSGGLGFRCVQDAE